MFRDLLKNMKQFRFSLQKYNGSKTRFHCPNCDKKEFVRYIDNETGEYLNDDVGRCNRIERCGYHFKPKQFFESKGKQLQYLTSKVLRQIAKETSYIDENQLLDSLHSECNLSNLYSFFANYFEEEKVGKVFRKYLVGVSNKWVNSTIFYQVDQEMKVRAGKILQYNSETGRRDKKKFYWIKNESEAKEMRQVFFGLHLINYFKNYKIGIVESEKTAMLCDLFFDEKIIWLASGGMEGINERKLKDLEGREVILFPDLSTNSSKNPAYKSWRTKAETFGEKLKMNIKINNYLELFSCSSDKENQLDLGDFIIKEISKNCAE